MSKKPAMEMEHSMSMQAAGGNGDTGPSGHLYIQTNELRNSIIHYHRSDDGRISEVDRVATGGAASGKFKPISGQESAPTAFEGAGSVILSPERRFLFAKSLAYVPSCETLYVLHSFGPDHLRLRSVDEDGNLTREPWW